jgi:hypothetical protein
MDESGVASANLDQTEQDFLKFPMRSWKLQLRTLTFVDLRRLSVNDRRMLRVITARQSLS